MFTIDYFGLGYTRSKNIEYAYYLEGFERKKIKERRKKTVEPRAYTKDKIGSIHENAALHS